VCRSPGTTIDVAAFAAPARPVAYLDLDLDRAFADRPLSPETLRCLRYMHDIESHTVCYLRDLLPATRLAQREEHPVLTELLERIQRQESRHVAFHATEPASGSRPARGRGGWSGSRCARSGHRSGAGPSPRRRPPSSCSTC
jgi:hypothetical protein